MWVICWLGLSLAQAADSAPKMEHTVRVEGLGGTGWGVGFTSPTAPRTGTPWDVFAASVAGEHWLSSWGVGWRLQRDTGQPRNAFNVNRTQFGPTFVVRASGSKASLNAAAGLLAGRQERLYFSRSRPFVPRPGGGVVGSTSSAVVTFHAEVTIGLPSSSPFVVRVGAVTQASSGGSITAGPMLALGGRLKPN